MSLHHRGAAVHSSSEVLQWERLSFPLSTWGSVHFRNTCTEAQEELHIHSIRKIPVYCSISDLRVLQNTVFTGKEGTNSAGVYFAGAGTDYRGKKEENQHIHKSHFSLQK